MVQRWEDLVFENRNKAYGAYVLRTVYTKNVIRGVILTLVIVALLFYSPDIIAFFKGKEVLSTAVLENTQTGEKDLLVCPMGFMAATICVWY